MQGISRLAPRFCVAASRKSGAMQYYQSMVADKTTMEFQYSGKIRTAKTLLTAQVSAPTVSVLDCI